MSSAPDIKKLLRTSVRLYIDERHTTITNIYQAIATQIEEVQGDDLKELSKIAKATIKYAINDAPARQRKRIEAYLDYISDGNLAYKYAEYPQWQRPEE